MKMDLKTVALYNFRNLKALLIRCSVATILTFSTAFCFGQVYPTFSINESGGTIHVSTYGAFPDDGIDDEDEIQAAIDAAGPNMVVVFAAGTYNFSAPDDPGRSSTLTGASGHIRVIDKTNITLRGAVDLTTGEPTTIFYRDLLFYPNSWTDILNSYERVSILDARHNTGMKLENIAFENKLHYTVGKVLSINSSTITVEILDGYPMDNGSPVASANVWTWDEVTEGEEILKIGEPSVTYGQNDGHYFTILDAQARTMQCVKSGNAFHGKAAVGDYVSWHYGWNARGTVYLTKNTNTHLENVHIYTALRSSLFISYSHNMYMNEVEIRPKNDRFAMSPRDGVHASRNTGEFVSENMYVKGARLDGYVVTGTAADVHSIADSRNLEIITDQNVGSTFNYRTSEPLYFYDNYRRYKVEVQSASYVSHDSDGTIYDITTSQDIPSFVSTATNLVPAGLSPDTVIVRNSTFKSIGGASELYFCDNVLSENNYHENIMYSPVRLGVNRARNHSGGTLKFINNTYVDNAWEGNFYKVSQYGYISSFNVSEIGYDDMYVTDLTIENNTFTSTTSLTSFPPIELDETGNVIISGNTYNGFTENVILWDVYNITDDETEMSSIINPSIDAYVKGGTSSNTNYGTDSKLVVKESSNANYDRMSFLRFDLSEISGLVATAKIRIKVSDDDSGASHDLHLVTNDSWTESGLTWNNMPSVSSLIGTQTVPAANEWIEFDVTAVVNSEGDDDLSIRVADANALEHYVLYHSADATDPADRPQLVYELAPALLGGPLADAYVKGGTSANTNYGTASNLVVKESSNANYDRISFLKFDLSAISGTVATAKIRIKVSTDDSGASHRLHSVNDDTWTETGITWNKQPSVSTLISAETVPSVDGWIEFDVASLVNNETDDILSVRLSDENAAEHYVLYHSKEATNADDRPQLVYTLDTGGARLLNAKEDASAQVAEKEISIYPNPASDQINIVGLDLKNASVELINLSGKSVLHKRLTDETSSVLNVSKVQKGIYFLKITRPEGEIIRRKIIVD